MRQTVYYRNLLKQFLGRLFAEPLHVKFFVFAVLLKLLQAVVNFVEEIGFVFGHGNTVIFRGEALTDDFNIRVALLDEVLGNRVVVDNSVCAAVFQFHKGLVGVGKGYDFGVEDFPCFNISGGTALNSDGLAFQVVTGKGNKVRRVPLMKNTAGLLTAYISEKRLSEPHKKTYPLFFNSQHNRLTKEGVAYIISKYAALAHEISDSVPSKVKCHMLRHSKAVHLLQAGVNLIYIRDFLGHTDVKTTEVYYDKKVIM